MLRNPTLSCVEVSSPFHNFSVQEACMRDCFSVRSALLMMLMLLLIGSTTMGQSTRTSLSGLINDQNGAAVSGAKIVAKHVATGEEFQTSTDPQGAFTFPSMPLGQYSVTIEATGFKRLEA